MRDWETCPKGITLEGALKALTVRVDDLAALMRKHEEKLSDLMLRQEGMKVATAQNDARAIDAEALADAIATRISERIASQKNGGLTWKQVALLSLGIMLLAAIGKDGMTALLNLIK